MQSFKLFLTFGILGAVTAGVAAFAGAPETPSLNVVESPVRVAESGVPAAPAAAIESAPKESVKREFIGYAWPFSDRDVKTELATGPIVLEEFTTQGCIFCPVADKFFNDLLENAPGVIGLACHVTYLNVKEGNISTKSCTDRQFEYAKTIPGSSVFTPQMIVNGRKQSFGFEYEKVYAILKDALKNPPATIPVTKKDGNHYSFALPAVKMAPDEKAEFQIFQVRGPVARSISDGPNQNMDMNYLRSVSSITTLEATGQAQVIDQEVIPEDNVTSIVAMVRVGGKIVAVSETKL